MPQERPSMQGMHHEPTQDQEQLRMQAADEARDSVDDLDDILDDLSAVLETNAEDYVRGFVQKGGQ
ncbi:ubiquitin-like protein Pup [Bifidobacterium cuniculi]|uniref:Prokaryotic ubiquitin-like protein Pup n=1 Tax=Bifidobacterium cuniculi TaxID=1688 RepID=A0A087AX39_9BIFI|nr:hypothetical protein BCUN_1307 [Bifidobacterium cuniculi]